MLPIVISVSILVDDDGLTNILQYPYYIPVSVTFTTQPDAVQRFRKITDTDKAIMLESGQTTISNGTPKSLVFMGGTTDYTVTTGKTAKLVLVLRSNTSTAQFKIWQSNAADTASGTAKYTYTNSGFSTGQFITVCPEWNTTELTFATGKYITIEVTSGSGQVTLTQAAVIES